MKRLSLVILLALFAIGLKAQTAKVPIQTDRPDQTESPSTVPPGFWQIEMGVLHQGNATDIVGTTQKDNYYVTPTVLTKYGINKTFELRLITEIGTQQVKVGNQNTATTGLNPVIAGMKINLIKGNDKKRKWLPKTSLILHYGLNGLAAKPFQTSYPFPQFRFLMQHNLSDKFALSYNLGGEWYGESNTMTTIYTISLAESFTKRLGAFVEFYGFLPGYNYFSAEQVQDHRFNGGILYLAEKNLQFDLSAGIGLSEASPDYFVSAGISFRLPK